MNYEITIIINYFIDILSIKSLNFSEALSIISNFGFRVSILTILISLGFFVSIRYSNNKRYNKLIPFFCAFLITLLTYFFLYNYSAGGRIFSDSSVVYEDFLKKDKIYPNAVGYSYLNIIISNLLNISTFKVVVVIGSIFCPFALYLAYFLFCKTFLTDKMANLASFIFLSVDIIFSGFISNIKQNFGIIFLLLCLYCVMNRKEDFKKKQGLILLAICFFALTFFHLLTFLIGTIVLIAVIEGEHCFINPKKRPFFPDKELLVILIIIPISIGLFYPGISQIIHNIIHQSFFPKLKYWTEPIRTLGEFLQIIFDFFNKIPFLMGIVISVFFYLFVLFIRILLVMTNIIQMSIKRNHSIFNEFDTEKLVVIASISLSLITWGLYSFYYKDYINLHYYNIFGYLFIHIGQIFFYGVSFYLIIHQLFPINQKTKSFFHPHVKGFYLTVFSLLLFTFITFVLLIILIPPIGNLERRFLDFLPIFQISYFVQKVNTLDKFQQYKKFRILSYSIFFILCVFGLLLGSCDPLFFKKGWSEL